MQLDGIFRALGVSSYDSIHMNIIIGTQVRGIRNEIGIGEGARTYMTNSKDLNASTRLRVNTIKSKKTLEAYLGVQVDNVELVTRIIVGSFSM